MRHQGLSNKSGAEMNLRVDVISVVMWPWCFIGRRRLEKAIAVLDREVEVHWLPFQLNPTMPKGGISRRDYRIKKFWTCERSLGLDVVVADAGKAEVIDFAFGNL